MLHYLFNFRIFLSLFVSTLASCLLLFYNAARSEFIKLMYENCDSLYRNHNLSLRLLLSLFWPFHNSILLATFISRMFPHYVAQFEIAINLVKSRTFCDWYFYEKIYLKEMLYFIRINFLVLYHCDFRYI